MTLNAGAHLAPGSASSTGTLTMDLGTGTLDLSAAVAAANTHSMEFLLNGMAQAMK